MIIFFELKYCLKIIKFKQYFYFIIRHFLLFLSKMADFNFFKSCNYNLKIAHYFVNNFKIQAFLLCSIFAILANQRHSILQSPN